jgi:hypothetical protein
MVNRRGEPKHLETTMTTFHETVLNQVAAASMLVIATLTSIATIALLF